MEDLAIRTYVALQDAPLRLRETLDSEDGQTAAEYVGILAFVAAVVGVIIAANSSIGSAIVSKITTIISGIGGGGA
ncbi:MAG: Flp family type IVb pilin [Actinomycetota bacterium]